MRSNSFYRTLFVLSVYIVVLTGIGVASAAGQSRLSDRINAVVSNANTVAISGSIHPKVSVATDLGSAPGDTKLVGMTLRFTPSAAQQAALDQLLTDQQNPASSRYHQWLTPQQYAAQFGLSSTDLAKITNWLASQGFTVTGVAQGGSFVTFDGTVAQAQTAFSTSIHSLTLNGETHFANVTGISVPSAFAEVVGAVTGLHDFRLKPHLHTNLATSLAKPNYTTSTGAHWLAPGDIYTIYNAQQLLNAGTLGDGVAIAVTGQVQISISDVSAFRSLTGLSTANLPTPVPVGGGAPASNGCDPSKTTCPTGTPNLDDLSESMIDVEWAGAMAPAANILFVNGPDVFDNSMTQAIDLDLAPIVTTSYGNCETTLIKSYLSYMNALNTLFAEANAQGQTIIAAAGDSGATDCDTSAPATQGLAVDFPGSSPYVTSMGGTEFAEGSGSYWNTNYSSSSNNAGSAISYIPEAVWSDETASTPSFGGGGGGISAYFSKPTWQKEAGPTGMNTTVPADSYRDVPDISLDASDSHDEFLFCMKSSCPNSVYLAGGTSFDSQIFGGMLALIEQKTGTRLGNVNPALYSLGNNATYYNTGSTSVFHDVTSGSNAMPCSTGTLNCASGASPIGYSAGTGYDLATGWGSVNLYNLANATSVIAPTVPGFTIGSSASLVSGVPTVTVAAGGTIPSVTITVTPVDGFTGTVTFTGAVYVNSGDSADKTPVLAFSPTSVTISSTSSATTALTFSGVTANLRQPNAPGKLDRTPTLAEGRFAAGSGVAIASLLLIVLPRRRRLGGLLLVALSVALTVGATGCGGSSQTTPSTTSTGTYVVTITATSSSSSITPQSTTVTYQIN